MPKPQNNEPEKNKGGRPLKFKDPKALEEKIQAYFEYCDGHIVIKKNLMYPYQLKEREERERDDMVEREKEKPKQERVTTETEPYTITGLALRLDCEIETIKEYSKRDKYSAPIKRAYKMVQRGYEERLHLNNPAGAIFALKNFNRSDKSEIDHTTQGDKITGIDVTISNK